MTFHDKIILVTGGTGALGTVVTKSFLKEGANVIATYLNDKELEYFNDEISKYNSRCTFIRADLFDKNEIVTIKDYIIKNFKRLDVLVNIAGGFIGGNSFVETSIEIFDKMYLLNFKTVVTVCKIFLPIMLENNYGKIINIGARAGITGGAGISAYASSKAALINFTQSIAAEVKKNNINVNIILPSIIDTSANRKSMPDADFEKWVKPESISKLIMFLASDDSKDINGAVIPLYGNA